MNAKKRLDELEQLLKNQQDTLINIDSLIDQAKKEIDGIEATISDSRKRLETFENQVTWDGHDPDCLIANGQAWRKANESDIGKIVAVCLFISQDSDPEKFMKSELIGIYGPKNYTIKGTKNQPVQWPSAWVKVDGDLDQELCAKKDFIRIMVGKPSVIGHQLLNDSQNVEADDVMLGCACSPEKLTRCNFTIGMKVSDAKDRGFKMGESWLFFRPYPTEMELKTEQWNPKQGDFVRIQKPEDGQFQDKYKWYSPAMDQFDGMETRLIAKANPNGCWFVVGGKSWAFDCRWMKPIKHQIGG